MMLAMEMVMWTFVIFLILFGLAALDFLVLGGLLAKTLRTKLEAKLSQSSCNQDCNQGRCCKCADLAAGPKEK